jgi:hypothetical protein
MNNRKYISQPNFKCVGLVAQHCNLEKLDIAIDEAKQFDIIPLFCFDFVNDVLENWNKAIKKIDNPTYDRTQPESVENPLLIDNPDYDQNYFDLIFGSNYTDHHQKTQQNLGFARVWVYYSYARYKLINQYNDTANGTVGKQGEFSLSTPLGEITAFSNKYRAMGKEAYNSLLGFLCQNKNLFPKFDDCNCRKSCGCSGSCSCGRTKKLTGIKYSTIKK